MTKRKVEKYGDFPEAVGFINIEPKEMMFYQYLPIKLKGTEFNFFGKSFVVEERLHSSFYDIIQRSCTDFVTLVGERRFKDYYIYLTVKNLWVSPSRPLNREGYHSDGFGTDDVNYIWCDKFPTVFNTSKFKLSKDDSKSLVQMQKQARKKNEVTYAEKFLLRLNQFNIHKVADVPYGAMRCFVKISFSKDKYDLEGNSHNYKLGYNWDMKPRKLERNVPQSKISKK